MSWPARSAYTGLTPAPAPMTVEPPPEGEAPARKPSTLATLAQKLNTAPRANKLERVKVDGLVLLKIIKHCSESLPSTCYGAILGMDVGSDLQITNSFPFPSVVEEEPEEDHFFRRRWDDRDKANKTPGGTTAEEKDYQREMLKNLTDINIDCNAVGLYQSCMMGSFASDAEKTLAHIQEELDEDEMQKAVLLVYDPEQTSKGNLYLKAFRLSESYMQRYRKRPVQGRKVKVTLAPTVISAVGGIKDSKVEVQSSADAGLSADEIFVELPVEVSNAHLFTVLLDDLSSRHGDQIDADFDRFDLSANAYLGTNLDSLMSASKALKELHYSQYIEKRKAAEKEQAQVRFITQRRHENAIREERGEALLPEVDPNEACFKNTRSSVKLNILLKEREMSTYTEQINRFAGSAFTKQYLAGAVQGKKIV